MRRVSKNMIVLCVLTIMYTLINTRAVVLSPCNECIHAVDGENGSPSCRRVFKILLLNLTLFIWF